MRIKAADCVPHPLVFRDITSASAERDHKLCSLPRRCQRTEPLIGVKLEWAVSDSDGVVVLGVCFQSRHSRDGGEVFRGLSLRGGCLAAVAQIGGFTQQYLHFGFGRSSHPERRRGIRHAAHQWPVNWQVRILRYDVLQQSGTEQRLHHFSRPRHQATIRQSRRDGPFHKILSGVDVVSLAMQNAQHIQRLSIIGVSGQVLIKKRFGLIQFASQDEPQRGLMDSLVLVLLPKRHVRFRLTGTTRIVIRNDLSRSPSRRDHCKKNGKPKSLHRNCPETGFRST